MTPYFTAPRAGATEPYSQIGCTHFVPVRQVFFSPNGGRSGYFAPPDQCFPCVPRGFEVRSMPAKRRLDSPPPRRHFVRSTGLAGGMVAASLAIGMAGYHFLNGESWVDAFVDAAMILGGMGPVGVLTNDAAKIFAGVYALF